MSSLVGLIPAAGRASRLGLHQGSKEVLPVASESGPPRPVIECLLDSMGSADLPDAYVVLRRGKWDIPKTLELRRRPDWPEIAYIVTSGTGSIPETVDRAFPFIRHSDVLLGFPDVRFSPLGSVDEVLCARRRTGDDVTLGLFPSRRPDKTDMVEVSGARVTGFRVKPGACGLDYTWILAAWGPTFSSFLHEVLQRPGDTLQQALPELQMSEVFAAALDSGLSVGAAVVAGGRFIDIGTPEDLENAAKIQATAAARTGESG